MINLIIFTNFMNLLYKLEISVYLSKNLMLDGSKKWIFTK